MSVIRCKFYGGKNVENLFWLNFVFEPQKKRFFFFLKLIFFEFFFLKLFLFEIIFF